MSDVSRPEWATPRHSAEVRNDPPPHSHCCAKFWTYTLIALSVIGTLSGVLGYLVASGNLPAHSALLSGLGSIGVHNSFFVLGSSVFVFLFTSIVLSCLTDPNAE